MGFLEDHHFQSGRCRGAYADQDLEDQHDGSEPSLGWTTIETSHGRSYAGSMGQAIDLEEQCEDEGEPDSGIADDDG